MMHYFFALHNARTGRPWVCPSLCFIVGICRVMSVSLSASLCIVFFFLFIYVYLVHLCVSVCIGFFVCLRANVYAYVGTCIVGPLFLPVWLFVYHSSFTFC